MPCAHHSAAWAHAVLKNDKSVLALKTDHADYYRHCLKLFDERLAEGVASATPATVGQSMMIVLTSEDYWRDAAALAHTAKRLFAQRRTLFERRFHKVKKPIFYLELQRR